MGDAKKMQGDHAAIDTVQRAIEVKPGYAAAHNAIAVTLQEQHVHRCLPVAYCRFCGHEDKIVTKELESGYDETEVQP